MMRGVLTRSNYSCSKTLQVFTISLSTAVCCMHFECLTSTDGWLTFYQPIRNAVWFICWGTEFKNPRGIEYMCFFFLPIAPKPLPPCLFVGQGLMAISHFTNHKQKTQKKNRLKGELNSVFQRTHWITDYKKNPLPINYASVTKKSQVVWMTFIRFKKIPNSYLYLVN